MLSRFFIDRPIFAAVIAIVIMLTGGLAIISLPVEQYPNIGLPQINVSANYPGANAQVIEDSVTQVIEQGMTGLDNLKYISAQSSSGNANVTLVFEAGTDPDKAQIQVQNQVQAITRLLPQDVQSQGVRINKSNSSPLMSISLYSPDDRYSNFELGDYMVSHFQDPISRINGVGAVNIFGSGYAMRIWLNPDQMASYRLTVAEVISAIRAQNTQVSAGSLGANPSTPDSALNAIVTAQSRLETPQQFENIIVRANLSGEPVRLKDVARIELGAESYSVSTRMNGHASSGMQIRMATGANALLTADLVKAKLEELSKDLPEGMAYAIPSDSTVFVKISIEDVVKTLIEAVVLVFVVMYIFLQNWRATLIPAIAVPVVLLGTFGILAIFGYSINTLTMFGLVLAIGLLVDDAIVVVENVERVMREDGLGPKEATRKSMEEITSALIGVATVLAAMFIPMAFFGGTQGIIYRQFSITLVAAMGLSVLVALILTPPLCATLLRPHSHEAKKPFFAKGFNHIFNGIAGGYLAVVTSAIKRPRLFFIGYGTIIAAIIGLFMILPTSFLPDEDQGIMTTIVQLPAGSTLKDTQKVMKKVQDYYLQNKTVAYVFAISGGGQGASGENQGTVITRLKPFEERKTEATKVFAIADKARKDLAKIPNANIIPTVPPTVRELGSTSGFTFQLKDTGGVGHEALMAARNEFISMASDSKLLSGVRAGGLDDSSQLKVNVDSTKASTMGVATSDINSVLSTALGGTYVNDFINQGRIKKVYLQGDAPFRMRPEDIGRWQVRNSSGDMVPLSAVSTTNWTFGPPRLERYNGVQSMDIQGVAAEGVSNGRAMDEVEALIAKLPEGIGFEWSGLSLQEKESGSQAPALYALSLVFIFLLLAALYESWSIPFAVILVVPFGVFGALLATYLRGLDNDIFFQVGLLATMGLAAKNAILIVEFARQLTHGFEGRAPLALIPATIEAARIRFRPIVMTSLAFTFGILPLVLANSAGARSQHAIGTGLFGGILGATFLAVIFVPLFFVIVQGIFGRKNKSGAAQ